MVLCTCASCSRLQYCYLHANAGWPGSVNDAKLFVHSTLYKKVNSEQLLPNAIRQINTINVPVFVMGDSAYPLLSLVMKSFTHRTHIVQGWLTTFVPYLYHSFSVGLVHLALYA